MNLGDYVQRSANYWPQVVALQDQHKQLTFAELNSQSNQLAQGLLAKGFERGSRIAVQANNCIELAVIEFALYKSGMTKVPLNARLSADESLQVLQDSEAHALVLSTEHYQALAGKFDQLAAFKQCFVLSPVNGVESYAELLAAGHDEAPAIAPADDDIAVLHYTSGSSGVLKAAMQTYGNRKASLQKFLVAPIPRPQVGDVFAHAGPVTHASGMQLLPNLVMGVTNLILPGFNPSQFLQAIERFQVNRVLVVPTMINMLLNDPDFDRYDLSSLKLITYGAAPMAPALVERAMAAFGPILAQGYGAGETASMVTLLTPEDHIAALAGDKKRLASCGRSYFDTQVEVVDEVGMPVTGDQIGEIRIRGGDVMAGYWRAPELSEEVLIDGYYYTGDMACVDDEGFIFIVDRKKEMIISGGFNVYPLEVEKVLYDHADIYEAAVVGVPDEQWGEAIKAVVVLKSGKQSSAEDIMAFCADKLAGFKKPRSVDFVDSLPKNGNGKVVRREVRERYWQDSQRQVG